MRTNKQQNGTEPKKEENETEKEKHGPNLKWEWKMWNWEFGRFMSWKNINKQPHEKAHKYTANALQTPTIINSISVDAIEWLPLLHFLFADRRDRPTGLTNNSPEYYQFVGYCVKSVFTFWALACKWFRGMLKALFFSQQSNQLIPGLVCKDKHETNGMYRSKWIRIRKPLANKYNNEIKYKQHNFDGAKSTKLKIK